jgi:uncharacterized membrane protein
MDLELFVGRFHPLIVHFPIALLVLASIIEVISRVPRFVRLSLGMPFVLVVGTGTAAISVLMGWFIANDRGYDDVILFWHRWAGVSILLLSLFLTLAVFKIITLSANLRTSLFVALFLLVSAAGHLGGSLTHGENYLFERAPAFLRDMFIGEKPASIYSGLPEHPDSVIVYRDMIAPLLIEKCTPCHNQTQKKGNLLLTTKEGILAGGDGGPSIRAGNAMESELFRRISLPPDHEKFMPLKEVPLSFAEVSLIAWWINQGASFEASLSDHSIVEVKDLLIRDFGFNPARRPYYETVDIPPADSAKVKNLRQAGFLITPLSQDNNFLTVSVGNQVKVVNPELLSELLVIKENITWLDLGDKQISNAHLPIIGQFSSLTALNLNGNPITDVNLAALAELKYLESLNLFNTEVGDEGLESLKELPSLKRIYLWKTKITPFGIDELKKLRPRLEIDTGSAIITIPLLAEPGKPSYDDR